MDGVLDRYTVPRFRLTVDDYHRMAEAGILGEDDCVELLEGQLVEMSPIGPRHAIAVSLLSRLLTKAVSDFVLVRPQNPIALNTGSEPQPDIVVTRMPWQGYPSAHPSPADIFLLVEVADSSRDIDLGAKRELYARAGVREFWIVDLTSDTVIVCRDPRGDRYDSVVRVDPSGTLTIEALPALTIPAAPLFP